MSQEDREKWNYRYATGEHASFEPSPLLVDAADWLPSSGKALDVAGGAGRHTLWLAERGLDVTLADISEVGLRLAALQASQKRLTIHCLETDLESDPLPVGPWRLIVQFRYLHRPLFRQFPEALEPGGTLFFVQPTVRNLERHARPPRPFLLDDGEAPRLVPGLEIVRYEEGWLAEGWHEALVIARRS